MKKRIENMNVLERRAAAERGGSLAIELDRLASKQVDDVWSELSDLAKMYIGTFSGCNGDFYIDFGDMTADEINEMVEEWAELDE